MGESGGLELGDPLFDDRVPTVVGLDLHLTYAKLAEAYGCAAFRITDPSELGAGLQKAFALPGPVVVDVWVDREECVFPMVMAGSANKDMILDLADAKRRSQSHGTKSER